MKDVPPAPPPDSGEPFTPGEPGSEPVDLPPPPPEMPRATRSRLRLVIGLVTILFAVAAWLLLQLLQAGNSTKPAPGAAQAHLVVNATDSDGRRITFESTVLLSEDALGDVGLGGNLTGRGTGPFHEVFVSDQCGFTITWSGNVGVDVVARPADSRVEVAINGPVTENGTWPGAECLDGVYYSPNRGATELGYTCAFVNVDLKRAGTYLGPPPEDGPNPYGCKLEYTPK